jgi:hypothetical protein
VGHDKLSHFIPILSKEYFKLLLYFNVTFIEKKCAMIVVAALLLSTETV